MHQSKDNRVSVIHSEKGSPINIHQDLTTLLHRSLVKEIKKTKVIADRRILDLGSKTGLSLIIGYKLLICIVHT